MRPLPRVHAFTEEELIGEPDFGVRAAAIAAAGSAVALHARAEHASTAALTALTLRLLSLARPPEAAVFVSRRADLAAAVGAAGVQLRSGDLSPSQIRRFFPGGWLGRSVHSDAEAQSAAEEGCDFLVVGSVYPTLSHPELSPQGLDLVHSTAKLGLPVIAIGGITPERAWEVQQAGAYGVAAIGALWRVPDPARAALALLQPWSGTS
jgi:thiamine-phosphate pyrophosphorylase